MNNKKTKLIAGMTLATAKCNLFGPIFQMVPLVLFQGQSYNEKKITALKSLHLDANINGANG